MQKEWFGDLEEETKKKKKKIGKKKWAVKKENQTGKASGETKNCFMNDRNHVCQTLLVSQPA